MPGSFVYVLTNPAMPGLVKIGRTDAADPATRVAQLYTTGVPVPFDLRFAAVVEDAVAAEAALHVAFGPYRLNPKREFFEIEPEQAIAVLRLMHITDETATVAEELEGEVPAQERQAGERLRQRRPKLNFDEMGIPVGAILTSDRNDDEIEVVGPKLVRYGGEEMAISKATTLSMNVDYSLAPGPYWRYQGELLKVIYDRTYIPEDDSPDPVHAPVVAAVVPDGDLPPGDGAAHPDSADVPGALPEVS